MKRSLRFLGYIGALAVGTSACYTTTLRSGLPSTPAKIEYDEKWHHGVLWGIAELSGPYDLSAVCPQGWSEIKTETSFLNGLVYSLTAGLYSPQTVTINCAQGGDEEAAAQGEGEAEEDEGFQSE